MNIELIIHALLRQRQLLPFTTVDHPSESVKTGMPDNAEKHKPRPSFSCLHRLFLFLILCLRCRSHENKNTASFHSNYTPDLATSRPGTWRRLTATDWTSNDPGKRLYHDAAAAQDDMDRQSEVDNLIILFGGLPSSVGKTGLPEAYSMTWIFQVRTNAWLPHLPHPSPPLTYGHTMVTLCHTVVVLFGGYVARRNKQANIEWRPSNATWFYHVTERRWKQIETAVDESGGVKPRARHAAVKFHQPRTPCSCKESVFVFAGLTESSPAGLLDDLWELRCLSDDLKFGWMRVNVSGNAAPRGRFSHDVFSDATRTTMFVYGGVTYGTGTLPFPLELPMKDLWQLTGTFSSRTWSKLSKEGPLSLFQQPIRGIYWFGDERSEEMLILCCVKPLRGWDVHGKKWVNVDQHGVGTIPLLEGASVVTIGKNVVVFGGIDGNSRVSETLWNITILPGLIWSWDQSVPPLLDPSHRWGLVVASDSNSSTVFVYGRVDTWINWTFDAWEDSTDNVWVLDTERSMWTVHRPSDGPLIDAHPGTVLANSVFVVFGGFSREDKNAGLVNHVWGYYRTQNRWLKYKIANNPDNIPLPRMYHSAVRADVRSAIVYGGVSQNWLVLRDSWRFTLQSDDGLTGKWSLLDVTKAPHLFGHSVVVILNKMYVYGGISNVSNTLTSCNKNLWLYDIVNNTWERIPTPARNPGSRCMHSATPLGRKMLITGGCVVWDGRNRKTPISSSRYNLNKCAKFAMGLWAFSVSDFTWNLLSPRPRPDSLTNLGVLITLGIHQQVVAFFSVFGTLNKGPMSISVMKPGCPAGTYSPSFFNVSCASCPRATYQVNAASNNCTPCPAGFATPGEHSTTSQNCSVCSRNEDFCQHGNCYVPADYLAKVVFLRYCDCSEGFTTDGEGRCTVPTYYLVATAVLVAVLITSLVGLGAVKLWKATKLSKMRARALTARQREVCELTNAWSIDSKELELQERIDGDTPGAFGEVYRARYRDMIVAVKRLTEAQIGWRRSEQEFDREIQFMRTVRHANIVLFLGGGRFHTDDCPFLVTEFMSRGSLATILKNDPETFSADTRIRFALDASKGMEFLHGLQSPRIHRDLKSANLLVSEGWVVKVADFGCARLVREEMICQNVTQATTGTANSLTTPLLCSQSDLSTDVGTLLWNAPELLTRQSYGTPVDVYRCVNTNIYHSTTVRGLTTLVLLSALELSCGKFGLDSNHTRASNLASLTSSFSGSSAARDRVFLMDA